jgi:hypothetical protein
MVSFSPADHALHEQIALGRDALAAHERPMAHRDRHQERLAIHRLYALLWHQDGEIRRAAALALPGGDRRRTYKPQYGHFAASFLRYVAHHSPPGRPPATHAARHAVVVAALRSMLEQSSNDIRGMSNMHYSFLSSALYLALLSTCRDVTESVRRVRDGALHAELCRLLWSLAQSSVVRRLNPQDTEALTHSVGQALAAMPADELTELWRWLTHHSRPRRRAVAPILNHLSDTQAVPHLLRALTGQPADIARMLACCLGRMGQPDALPALTHLTRSRHRALRSEAQAAIEAIRRANAAHPSRTLLRPIDIDGLPEDRVSLLHITDAAAETQRRDELLRPTSNADDAR